jgi:hypothetical protein
MQLRSDTLMIYFMPSEDDALEACDAAEKVFLWLQNALPELFQEPHNGH